MSKKDYIEKHLLLKCIKTVAPNSNDEYSPSAYWAARAVYNDIKDIIEGATPVDVAPVVHGRWMKDIDNKRKWDRVRYYCSSCGDWQTYGEPKYCPNCGAKMGESEEPQ